MLIYEVLKTECGVTIRYKGWSLCATPEVLNALMLAVAKAYAMLDEDKK